MVLIEGANVVVAEVFRSWAGLTGLLFASWNTKGDEIVRRGRLRLALLRCFFDVSLVLLWFCFGAVLVSLWCCLDCW